ncbi:Vacuolar amino acid transporter like [Actinidia chinensis var. chinensis]|uniref:Vacuolar amino acid transporter like n=1 Tax=Actinidia chinensis var. chinensis TaxID=1590841 RepID=A0A2R6R8Y8_ACTCC|nr:Vacuolar amino acid transporter like [Actinidia chinensis var. chinensis]
MFMGKNCWKSIPDCLANWRPQVASSETVVHAEQKESGCNGCLEENKLCQCIDDCEVGEKEVVEHDHATNANSSFGHSVINMVGMLIGLGQLSTPYALQNGGWASVFLLVGLGIVCAYSSHLLGRCLDKNPKLMNYSDIGHQAFGTKGRVLATSFIYLEIFMALVSYTISLHDNLTIAFFGLKLRSITNLGLSTSQSLTVVAVLVALPSLWLRDLSSISFLSSGGILMSFVIFTTVACTAVFRLGGVTANRGIPILRIDNVPAISGLYIFSFAGHIVFPDIYKGMKDPSEFTKVSIVSFSFVTMLYTALAFMGAKMFGAEINSQITLSMPLSLIVTKIALWATVLTPMTKYALEFAPFAMQLERNLPNHLKPRTKMIVRGGIGSLLLLVILVLALSIPYFEYVLSLTGSLVSVGICIIFPCAFYTKVFWSKISKPLLVLNVILILVGCLLGFFGTISSSKLLLRNLHRAHPSP